MSRDSHCIFPVYARTKLRLSLVQKWRIGDGRIGIELEISVL